MNGQLTAQQISEGVQAGLIKVSFTGTHEPKLYDLVISNGSGTKTTQLVAATQTAAATWAGRWAAGVGPGWYLVSVTAAEDARTDHRHLFTVAELEREAISE